MDDQWLYDQGRKQGCGLKPISALSKDEEKSAKPVTGRNLKPGLPEIVSTVWASQRRLAYRKARPTP